VKNDGDRFRSQANINALHKWSSKWKMPFHTDKCEVITFSKGPTAAPQYSLGNSPLECVDQTTYLGIQMQSNLKFDKLIASKIKSASKILGCIKYFLHEASERGKLLAYTSLCRPILEYGDTLWDPSDNTTSDAIEHVQSQAVRFIKNIKGRRGVTEGRAQLELKPLKDRRKSHRLSLLMRILSDETRHQTLASAYDELVNSRSQTTDYTSC
jgi:hypothetical protein